VNSSVAGKDKVLSLDNVRDGDLITLARAVKVLTTRHLAFRRNSAEWISTIESLKHSLLEQQSQGTRTASASLEELKEARMTLDHVLQFLENHKTESLNTQSAALLSDLIRLLQTRIDSITTSIPRIIKTFDTVRHAGGQLDQVIGHIRGGQR
jgi:DNA anti-recombination protein RmuC